MTTSLHTTCCIAGGGPAGMMLGFLLARQGIDVTVLEKWPDFFRDFRGDTIHPSTMEFLHDIGLLEKFLSLPHQKSRQLSGFFNEEEITIADFSTLNVRAPYVAFMPQWDFLNFIAEEARAYPAFHLMMETEATGILTEEKRVIGIQAKTPKGPLEIRAPLVIAADGRSSTVRKKSGLKKVSTGVPIDVLWFPIPREETDPPFSLGRMKAGQFLVMLERDTYWQCGYVIPKDTFDHMKTQPIDTFHEQLSAIAPLEEKHLRTITTWDDLKLLSVTVDYLPQWYRDGLLCIGDAAHAMSPLGGVGINLAIQDAIAAARILGPELKGGSVSAHTLAKVQKRRMFPARIIQRIQVLIQNNVIYPVLEAEHMSKPPLPFRLARMFPVLRRIPAYLIGIGIRPERL